MRAGRVAELVRAAGIPIVERAVTRMPGKLCSEDEFQIAVEAYRDNRRQPGRSGATAQAPTVILQRIRVEWTKASRGEPGARARAAVADCFPLPASRGEAVLVHDLIAKEEDAFEPLAAADGAKDTVHGVLGPIEWTTRENGSLLIAFRADGTGAPRRAPRSAFSLRPGQWGSLIVNERLALDRGWRYGQTIVNVAFATPWRADLFTATSRSALVDLRARLR